MKRYGSLFGPVTEFANLLNAAAKAMRGHQHCPAVARFGFNLEPELFQLQEELIDGTYLPQPYHIFTIHEPKERQICAAPIRRSARQLLTHVTRCVLSPTAINNIA